MAPAAAVAGAALVLENHAMREEREWLKNELKLISDRVRVFSAGGLPSHVTHMTSEAAITAV